LRVERTPRSASASATAYGSDEAQHLSETC
jgi:hypothetical protein